MNIWTLAKKEFNDRVSTPIAAVFLTVFLFLAFWLFFSGLFVTKTASLRPFFSWMPTLFLIMLPAISMGLWADEKKSGTFETLLTLPLSDFEIIFGKLLGAFLFLLLALALTLTVPLTVGKLGDLDLGPVLTSYLGLILLGTADLAVGLFISSLTKNPIIAFLITVVCLFFFFIAGETYVTAYFPDMLSAAAVMMSFSRHFESMSRGVLDSVDVIYFLSVIVFFIALNKISLEMRKI